MEYHSPGYIHSDDFDSTAAFKNYLKGGEGSPGTDKNSG